MYYVSSYTATLKLVEVLIYVRFILKMDLKVIGGLSVSHTNLLNIMQGYKLRGQQHGGSAEVDQQTFS